MSETSQPARSAAGNEPRYSSIKIGPFRAVRALPQPRARCLLHCATIIASRRPIELREGDQAVQSISEIIQTIARQRGRGETPAQVTLFQLEAAGGERISHL